VALTADDDSRPAVKGRLSNLFNERARRE
jgi:hypothetical protein